ncbi:MAG TPA: glycerol-3-phosphate dehydrogenase/oxidase [Mycobacteriales bacterium]|nr:glycerol-3-phosphate dehydrogenase/oxidase [Mycobacteriales bacterium]
MTRADSMLTAARRGQDLAALLAGEVVDVLVIGGGVTGAGVALDAASRGLSVALIERRDLAAGTSRWSSKLAHGGIRYIAKGQLGVAWESAVERNRLATTIAPHLVQPMAFLLPYLPGSPRGGRAGSRLLFTVADGLRAASHTPPWLPRTDWADASETRRRLPALRASRGAYVHVDGALEDDARLVVALARTAARHGARIVTHCSAVEVSRDGAQVRDELTGESGDIRARSVVVAAGVWSGGLVTDVPLRPSKGAHLVMRAEAFEHPKAALNLLIPGTFNRFVFALPRPDGTMLVGLTDEPVDEVEDTPAVTATDESYLLEMISTGLTRPVTAADVIGRYAGLRPLLGGDAGSSSADLSRRHALLDRDGVLVIVGGKLTTYRRMAQDAVDRVAARLGHEVACRTIDLPLVGAIARVGSEAGRLRRRFGAEADAVAACGATEPIAPDVPVLKCEVGWALQAEGAVTAEDILDRRLRVDLVPAWRDATASYVDEVLDAI